VTAGWARSPRTGLLVALILLLAQAVGAQDPLPILRAKSAVVDIQDGDLFLEGGWLLDPAAPLDIYLARRSPRAKRVTFITDLESMSFDVEPGRTYDFIIDLEGKGACRTRISTLAGGCRRLGDTGASGPETLPISLRGGMVHLEGTVNGSRTLDLIFDTGADTGLLYPSAVSKGALLHFDGTAQNLATGGTTTRRTSSDNRLQIAGLAWDHEPFLYAESQLQRADGIVGYTVFEDKVLEFDYDRMVMVVHDALPAHAAGFAKIPMPFAGALTAVRIELKGDGGVAEGPFILDTAGTGAMHINRAFAKAHGLRELFPQVGTSTSRGLGRAVLANDVLRVPELTLAGFTLRNVPVHVERPSEGDEPPPGGVVCMDVLQRFDALLDYPGRVAYFRPNGRFGHPFKAPASGIPFPVIVGAAVASVALLLGAVGLVRKRRRGAHAVAPKVRCAS